MGNTVGAFSKAAFRLESDAGMVNAAYPTTVAGADTEEVLLKSSDQITFLSESLKENLSFEQDVTLLGTPGVPNTDLVSILPAGSLEIRGFYDGLDALIAAAMGFELPLATNSPAAQNSTALISTDSGATSYKDGGNPFASGDIGKFIRVVSGAAEGQVRRISAFVGAGEVTITPAWDSNPVNATTAVMAQEWLHLFELSNHLHDELWTSVYGSYPTGGVGTANDQIIRRGTLGLLKWNPIPQIWRSCFINSLTISLSAGGVLSVTAEFIPFDLDKTSSTNTTGLSNNWAFDHASPLFVTNEQIIFPEISYFRIAATGDAPLDSGDNTGIREFTITINNNLKVDDMDASSTFYRLMPMRNSHREITGNFKIPRYNADTFFDFQNAESELIVNLKITGSTIASSARYINFWLPSLKLESGEAPVGGAGVVPQSYNFRCLTPGAAVTGFPTQNLIAPRSELMIQTLSQNPYSMFRDQQKEY